MIYKLSLNFLPGIGPVLAKRLIAYTGSPEAIFREKTSSLEKIPGIGPQLAAQIKKSDVTAKAEKEIAFIQKYNIGVSYYLDKNYPTRLKECEDGPLLLFYRGNPNWNEEKIIAIVGTRNASNYGKEICEKLIRDISERNHKVVIVSGLAYGIDITAHKAALKDNIDTFAILGHGLSTIYPPLHGNTAKEIAAQGALITEFVSDTGPDRNNFVRRNRVIAGLSDATIVVESGLKGGALITADIANSYNRDVFAFPGRTIDTVSSGCNRLIKNNKAFLIENIDDLEYIMGWDKPSKNPKTYQTALFQNFTDEEKLIINDLENHSPQYLDILAQNTSLPVHKISAILLNLEFSGIIISLPGKQYKLAGR